MRETIKSNSSQWLKMTGHRILLAFCLVLLACLAPHTAFAWGEKKPTAIIVDNETGKPVEGVVAVAQWFKSGSTAWWEGGGRKLRKAVEVFSDAEGKIYIDGFWSVFNSFTGKPRLTVYKGGYVVWDSWEKCPRYEKRTDFDRKNRIIRLQEFDKYYPLWMKKYHYIKYPHSNHEGFLGHFLDGAIHRGKYKIRRMFDKHENHFILKERREMSKTRKEEKMRLKNNQNEGLL